MRDEDQEFDAVSVAVESEVVEGRKRIVIGYYWTKQNVM